MFLFLFWLCGLTSAYDFSDFVAEFKKSYHSQEEYQIRKSYFQANYSKILEVNKNQNTFKLGVNSMTDWTQAQINKIFRIHQNTNLVGDPIPALKVSVATTLDWRQQDGVITPAKDQGFCGSCWAFSATATYESILKIHTNISYDLSEQYVLECSLKNGCQGSTIEKPFLTITQKNPEGIPQESVYPYTAQYGLLDPPNTPGICKTKSKINGNQKYGFHQYFSLTIDQLKGLLADSPVTTGFSSNDNFTAYKSGVFKCNQSFINNHAVELIGYDDNGWIIKNSWGSTWGENGFGRVDYNNSCGMLDQVYQYYKAGPMLMIGTLLLVVLLQ